MRVNDLLFLWLSDYMIKQTGGAGWATADLRHAYSIDLHIQKLAFSIRHQICLI